jgi:hypothetical protein
MCRYADVQIRFAQSSRRSQGFRNGRCTGKKRQKPVKTGHIDPLRPGVLGYLNSVEELCNRGIRNKELGIRKEAVYSSLKSNKSFKILVQTKFFDIADL